MMAKNHKRRRPGGRRSGLYRVVCGQWLRACSGSDQEADIRCNREAELPAEPIRARIGHEEDEQHRPGGRGYGGRFGEYHSPRRRQGTWGGDGRQQLRFLLSFQKPSTNKLADHLLDVYRKQSADGLILMGAAINQPYGELIKNRFPLSCSGGRRCQACVTASMRITSRAPMKPLNI